MSQKIAVAIVHGIGKQKESFANPFIRKLKRAFSAQFDDFVPDSQNQLVCETVFWQPCLQSNEDNLWKNMKAGGKLGYGQLRRYMIDFAGDAIAYQPGPDLRKTYDEIHGIFSESITALADGAGKKAPLFIVAHSLGSVITSNYFYDLQVEYGERRAILSNSIKQRISDNPLEKGETLTSLFTLGSPLALWSLRYEEFGSPIRVPAPQLADHWPGLRGEWINIYDRHDVIGYPIKTLNLAYGNAVTADREIGVGGLLKSWNPACHTGYWMNNGVITTIAKSLAAAWQAINK